MFGNCVLFCFFVLVEWKLSATFWLGENEEFLLIIHIGCRKYHGLCFPSPLLSGFLPTSNYLYFVFIHLVGKRQPWEGEEKRHVKTFLSGCKIGT